MPTRKVVVKREKSPDENNANETNAKSDASAESEHHAEHTTVTVNNTADTQQPRKVFKSIVDFKFNDVLALNTPVNQLSNADLLRLLVARASREGQKQLYLVLLNTLKAYNHECEFPKVTLSRTNPRFSRRNGEEGNNRRFGNEEGNTRRFGNEEGNTRRFGNEEGNTRSRFGDSSHQGHRQFREGVTQTQNSQTR